MAPIPVLANPGADTIDWMLTMNLIQTLEQEEIARLNKTIRERSGKSARIKEKLPSRVKVSAEA
jgi:hypothetical protein